MNFLLRSWSIGLVLSMVLSGDLLAQAEKCNCFIKGIVRDDHSGRPVPGATLLLIKSNQGEITDADGRYQFTGLCPGKYEIECRIIGYQARRDTVDLVEGHEENFSLAEAEIHLKDVEITAHRTDAPTTQPLTTLTGSELAQTRGLSLGESLSGMAGLTTLHTGSSIAKPVIHGMHSNRVLILNNGVRQEGQQWGSEHAPEIDPFVATRLSVVKGAAGVRYGSDAIGGVILVQPEELPINKPLRGELNLAGFSNGRQGAGAATLQGSIKKWEGVGWRAQGTIKRGGNIRTPQYFLDNTGVEERNYSLALGYRKGGFGVEGFYSHFNTKIGIFSGSHIGSLTDLQTVINSGEPLIKAGFNYAIDRPFQQVKHDLLKGEIHYHFPDGNRLTWVAAFQHDNRLEFDLHAPRNDSLAGLNRPELSFQLSTITNDVVWDHRPLAGLFAGQLGISTLYQYNIMQGRVLIPNFDQWNAGVFAIERLVRNKWELEAGARYDYRSLTTYQIVSGKRTTNAFRFHNASGTLGASRHLNDYLSLQLNIGTAWRAPNVSELFSNGVHHGAAAFEDGDATLKPEKALNTIGSIRYSRANMTLEVGGYYNLIRNYIYLQPQAKSILTVRGAFPYFKYTQTNATFKGLDISANWQISTRISWASKVSYLRVDDVRNTSYLVMIPPNRWDNQVKFIFKNTGKEGTMYLSLGNLWVGEQQRVAAGSDFAPPPPGYSLWNVQWGGTLLRKEDRRLEVTVRLENALNTEYRDYMNRFRYYAADMGRNASVRLRYVFGK